MSYRSDRVVPLDISLLDALPRDARDARDAQAIELARGIWCLRLPLPYRRTRYINCYLLADNDGYVLVDCGPTAGAGWDALDHALARAGVTPSAIHTLLLTHLHADHASLAATVLRRTGARLLRGRGPDTLYDRLRDPVLALPARRRDAHEAGVPAHEVSALIEIPLAHDAPARRPTPDRALDPGDVILTRTGAWRVVPTPGHSPAQIALFNVELGWLLAADVAYPGTPPYLEYGYTPDPYAESLTSIACVEALAPVRLLAGHGRPDDDPAHRLVAAGHATRSLLETTRRTLSATEARSAYDVACRQVGDDPDPDVRGSRLSMALCALEHLCIVGAVAAERDDRDGIRRFRRTA